MATVPTYDNFRAAPTGGAQPYIDAGNAPAPGAVNARQLQDAGAAAAGAGTDLMRIARAEQDSADKVRVADSLNEAVRLRTELQVQAIQLRGRNALERPDGKALPDEFTDKLGKQLSQIRDGLGNAAQKEQFGLQAGQLLNQFRGVLSEHMVSQQRAFEDETDRGTIATAQNQAALLWGDATIRGQSTMAIMAAVASRAARLGWDDKMREAALADALSPMHVGVMQGLIQAGQATAAREYYEQNSATMTLQARAQMQGVIKEASDTQAGEAGADAVWTRLGPQTANDPVRIFDMEQSLRESLKSNPDAMKRGIDALRQRAQAFNAQQAESNAAGINAVYAQIDGGVPLAQVMRSPAWLALPDIKRHEIRKAMESEALVREQRAAAAEQRELTRMQRNDRLAMLNNADAYLTYSDPSVLSGMTRNQVLALRPALGFEAAQHLAAKWDGLQKADGKLQASIDQQDFDHVADQLGLKPFATSKSEDQKRQLGELKFRVEQLISTAQQAKKGPLDRMEKIELMRQEMARQVAVPTWFGLSSEQVPVIQLTPQQASRVAVPAADRAQIAAALKVMAGRDPTNPLYAPTEDNMRRLYLMRQSPAGGLIPAAK